MKNLRDRVSKLEFEFPRLQDMAESVPTGLVESTSRDLKALRMELEKTVAKNKELEGWLVALRAEMNEMKGKMEGMMSHANQESREGGEREPRQRNNILSVSYSHSPALTVVDDQTSLEDSARDPVRLDGHTTGQLRTPRSASYQRKGAASILGNHRRQRRWEEGLTARLG